MCTHNAILSKPPTRGQLHCCYVKVMQLFTTVALWSLMSGPCLEKTRASNDWDVYFTGPSMPVFKNKHQSPCFHSKLSYVTTMLQGSSVNNYLWTQNVFTLEGALTLAPCQHSFGSSEIGFLAPFCNLYKLLWNIWVEVWSWFVNRLIMNIYL